VQADFNIPSIKLQGKKHTLTEHVDKNNISDKLHKFCIFREKNRNRFGELLEIHKREKNGCTNKTT
jgi:hypothetical protein